MNDKTISKMIPKIHLRLLVFFLFLFFTGFFTFIALVEGISITHLKLGEIKVEQLYLKWDNRLHIKASLIDLSDLTHDKEPIDLQPLSQLPTWTRWTRLWIDSIEIDTISYQQTSLSLHYTANQISTMTLHHNGLDYIGSFTLDPSLLHLTLQSTDTSGQADVIAHFNVHIPTQKITADATIKLPKSPALKTYLYGDTQSLQFKVIADQPFSTIEPIVDYFNIDQETKPWITTYAKGSQFIIEKFVGNIRYDNPKKIAEQIYIKGHVTNAEYTFDPFLEPIKAKKVELIFHKGKLFIFPEEGTFYQLPTEQSKLFIDFMTPHTMLHAHIQTHQAQLNRAILNMLSHYEITVPIEQLNGTCDVDLRLGIDLHTFDTTAKGTFKPSLSELSLDGFQFNTSGGIVKLDTTKVTFSGFNAHYKNIADAFVNGDYDAIKESGKVNVQVSRFTPTGNPEELNLAQHKTKLQIDYLISPLIDRINVSPSEWSFYGDPLILNGFSTPFKYSSPSIKVSKLPFSLNNQINGTLEALITSNTINLNANINKISYKGIQLRKSPISARFVHDDNTTIFSTPASSFWSMNGQNFSLSPLNATLTKNNIIFNNIKILVDKILSSTASVKYTFDTHNGEIVLSHLQSLNPKLSTYMDKIEKEKIDFKSMDQSFSLHSDNLGIDLETVQNGWKMAISDLSLIAKNSPLLRQYEINNGTLNLFYFPKDEHYTFNGEVNYPYKIMMINDESVPRYRFSGSSQGGKSIIRINDRLTIRYGDTIDIRANNMGINAQELYRWITHSNVETSSSLEETEQEKSLHLYVTNGYLFLMKKRKIMADSINAELSEGVLEGHLNFDTGIAHFKVVNGLFYIQGDHFNDRFMEHLFAFSDFYGGKFSFKAQGTADAFDGIMKVENTVLKEYKLLNNVLSFINTVPSLATFSLPNYNTKGLPVKEAFSHFTYENHWLTTDNLVMDSPEIKLLGNTRGNLMTDTIEGEITLKTDLGSSLGKVPVVGYILFGEDGSLSTTLKITGKMSDPVVETAFAKEVGSAPFNIIKRTLIYPFKWMIDDKKKK